MAESESASNGMDAPSRWTTVALASRRRAGRLIAKGKRLLLKIRLRDRWAALPGRLERRVYPSYAAYVNHQRTKLSHIKTGWMERYTRVFSTALRERLHACPISWVGKSVLCLGARQGTEVRVFIQEGAFAVGIDLNPGRDNSYVLVGDFHHLQFADRSVDVVYTNALDHAFDLARVMAEIRRVLTDDSVAILDVVAGQSQGREPGFYESLCWSSTDDLLNGIQRHGFELVHRGDFTEPWPGEQLILRKYQASS